MFESFNTPEAQEQPVVSPEDITVQWLYKLAQQPGGMPQTIYCQPGMMDRIRYKLANANLQAGVEFGKGRYGLINREPNIVELQA